MSLPIDEVPTILTLWGGANSDLMKNRYLVMKIKHPLKKSMSMETEFGKKIGHNFYNVI